MKQKYILGIYDKLIDEIKYNKKTTDSEIIAYLKNCSNESYYLYKIKLSKQQGKIKFAHQKKVHNLHPHAPDFIKSDCDINPEWWRPLQRNIQFLEFFDNETKKAPNTQQCLGLSAIKKMVLFPTST